jgi:Membrane domain of glycerophosphoryl diester phosphodiesterase
MGSKPLEIRGVLKDTTRVYRSLFRRSFVTGFLVFAVLGLFEVLADVTHNLVVALTFGLLAVASGFIGTTFVQGALVDAVDSEHRGVAVPSVGDLYRSSWRRLGSLVWLSIVTGVGVAFGLFLLIVPGVLLAIRWALAAPIVMLEDRGARDAMKRSREIVRGHRGAVFRVLLNIWGRTAVAWFFLSLILRGMTATAGHPIVSLWIGGALASALVTPYAGHALSVVYYRLTDPDKPVIAEQPVEGWHSIWGEHDAGGDSSTA